MPAATPQGAVGTHYRAFISYSSLDDTWGKTLHRTVERYRIPSRLVGTVTRAGEIPRRLFPVYRDRDEAAAEADLGDALKEALRRSEWLIVICSPRSARSLWVNEEVHTFKRMGKAGRILCAIVDGEPNASNIPARAGEECFCEALRFHLAPDGKLGTERTEPIAADFRKTGDGPHGAKIKLIAGLLGVSFDELAQRDRAARRHRQALIWAGVTATALVTAAGAYLVTEPERARLKEQAEQERQSSTQARAAREQAERDAAAAAIRERQTEQAQQIEESLRLAQAARQLLDEEKPGAALKAALRALPIPGGTSRPFVDDAYVALLLALNRLSLSTAIRAEAKRLNSLAVDEGGTRAVTVGEAGAVHLWNLKTLERAAPLTHPEGKTAHSATFDPAGRRIVAQVASGAIAIWDSESRKFLGESSPLPLVHSASEFAFSADGSLMLVPSGNTLNAWLIDTANGSIRRRLGPEGNTPATPAVVALSADGALAALGNRLSPIVTVYNTKTGDEKRLEHHKLGIRTLSFGPRGLLISAAGDPEAVIWNGANGSVAMTSGLAVDRAGNRQLPVLGALFEQHRLLVFGSRGAAYYDLPETLSEMHMTFKSLPLNLKRVSIATETFRDLTAFHKTSPLMLTSDGKDVFVWHTGDGSLATIIQRSSREQFVLRVAFGGSPDEIVVAQQDGVVRVHDLRIGAPARRFDAIRASDIARKAISIQRKLLAQHSFETVEIFNLVTGDRIAAWRLGTIALRDLQFDPAGRRLVAALGDDTVRLFEIDARRETFQFEAGSGENTPTARFSADGKRVVAANFADRRVRVWDAETGERRADLHLPEGNYVSRAEFVPGQPDHVLIVVRNAFAIVDSKAATNLWTKKTGAADLRDAGFDESGSRLVTLADDVRVWDVAKQQLLAAIKGRFAIAKLDPKGRFVATGSDTGQATIWDAESGKEVARLNGHRRAISSIAFDRDSATLVTADVEGVAIVWRAGDWRPVNAMPAGSSLFFADAEGHVLGEAPASFDGPRGGDTVRRGTPDHRVALWSTRARPADDVIKHAAALGAFFGN